MSRSWNNLPMVEVTADGCMKCKYIREFLSRLGRDLTLPEMNRLLTHTRTHTDTRTVGRNHIAI